MTRVTFEGRRFPILDGENVLDALIRGGSEVEHSCRKGTCQVCLLKVTDGSPGTTAQRGLSPDATAQGYFLPCQCRPVTDLTVVRPNRSDLFQAARVQEKSVVAPGIARILLEPSRALPAAAGKFISIRSPTGLVRSYSLANVPEEDYFFEIHVKKVNGGAVSTWLVDRLAEGDIVELSGPAGSCTYEVADPDAPLLLIGTGTGIGAMAAIARDAARRGHRGSITVVHGVRDPVHLYWSKELRTLERSLPNLSVAECASGNRTHDAYFARAVDVALGQPIATGTHVFLAGAPGPVEEARIRCRRYGVATEKIHADPFESHPARPRDKDKLRSLLPDDELWDALEGGAKLKRIFEDFYSRVYRDPFLAPFFHRVTKQRAIDKQYEFSVDLFTGKKSYFGLGPYNAHHWMVISDELFDYRERLLEDCIRREEIPEHLMYRWLAIDEMFRREIVKASPRGLFVDGQERAPAGWEEIVLAIGSLCDGCETEMPPGTRGRINGRTGQMFCGACAARRVGETIPPTMKRTAEPSPGRP